jgi:hypothetical protein
MPLLELIGRCGAVHPVTLSCVRSSAGPRGCAHDRTCRPCVRSLSGASDHSLIDWLTDINRWNLTNAVEWRDTQQALGDRTHPTGRKAVSDRSVRSAQELPMAMFVLGSINRKVPAWSSLLALWHTWHPCEPKQHLPLIFLLDSSSMWDWEWFLVHLLEWLHLIALRDRCDYGFLITLGDCRHLDGLEQ